MNDRPALAWLSDARSHALEAREIAKGFGPEKFDENRHVQLAVRYCLAVVGEALNKVPKDVQALAPEISWSAIYNLRNRLIHGFWLIDTQIILRIAQNDAEPLVASIDRLIEKIES
jgi:uncharacterized protein with HEPN domain